MKSKLLLYSLLSSLPFPKSYLGKIMLIAFLGTHVPLLVLIFYSLYQSNEFDSKLKVLLITLVATLLGTAFTLYMLYLLLSPVSLASSMLRDYINNKKMPELPTEFTDEVGRLMADIQYTVKNSDELIQSLEKTSMTDYLTGVYNRYSCEMRLREDVARARRVGETMSLVMLDIDDFKLINDRYGHDNGDTCLRQTVDIIRNNIRQGDWLARWGGDEFILMLFNSDEESSVKTMERIGFALGDKSITTQQSQISLTLSIGICQYNGEDEPDTLFKKVDIALLQAKRRGKGQIVAFSNFQTLFNTESES
ncbi:MAG: GGDEF domain-containing protein [Deltaproteobacteria bacterium]|nr:GGDEF domain-containing protein [Deltaproteobacteria bacterium]